MTTQVKAMAARFLAATIVAFGGSAAAAAPAHAAVSWQLFDLNGDGDAEAAMWDGNANGYVEDVWLDYDNDGRWDSRMLNTWGTDVYLEWVTFDLNENGRPEVAFWDYDHQVGYEWMYLDLNQDGQWDAPALSTSQTAMIGGTNPILSQSLGLDYSGLRALAPGSVYGCVPYTTGSQRC